MKEEWRNDIQTLIRKVNYWFSEDCPGITLEQFEVYGFGNEYYPVLDSEAWVGVSTVLDRDSGLKYSAMTNISSRMRKHSTEDGIRCWLIKDMTEGISRAHQRWRQRQEGR